MAENLKSYCTESQYIDNNRHKQQHNTQSQTQTQTTTLINIGIPFLRFHVH